MAVSASPRRLKLVLGGAGSRRGLGGYGLWALGHTFPVSRSIMGGGWQFKAALDYVADLRGRVARHFRLAEV